MKMYTKPELVVEQFAADQSVAANCGRLPIGSEDTPSSMTVTCEIGGQTETIFTSKASGCGASTSTDGQGNSYGYKDNTSGDDYFVWYTGDTAGSNNKPTDDQKKTMLDLLSSIFTNNNYSSSSSATGGDGRGWHYGIVSIINNIIYGYSY